MGSKALQCGSSANQSLCTAGKTLRLVSAQVFLRVPQDFRPREAVQETCVPRLLPPNYMFVGWGRLPRKQSIYSFKTFSRPSEHRPPTTTFKASWGDLSLS